MTIAFALQRFARSRGLLACLIGASLLGAARADMASDALLNGAPIADAPEPDDESIASRAQQPEANASLVGDPIPPAESMVVRAQALSQPLGRPTCDTSTWPSCGCATQAAPQGTSSSVWQWVPMGMIPYVGPRTPDDQKDIGIGQPLQGIGWRCRPFSISAFTGATDGGPLIAGHIYQRPSFYGGLNFGWDYDHYWGIEKRLGFGALSLANGEHQPMSQTGMSVTGEYRVMYYPLGDARWRPFLTAGVGWSDFYFSDYGSSHLETVGMVPMGFGMKYLVSGRIAARVDVIDEYTFGNNLLSNFQYVAVTAGVEVRCGHRWLRMPWQKSGS